MCGADSRRDETSGRSRRRRRPWGLAAAALTWAMSAAAAASPAGEEAAWTVATRSQDGLVPARAARVWATAAVLAGLGGMILVAARRRAGRGGVLWPGATADDGPLRVVAQRPLSGAHRVALVEVDGDAGSERLVVALSAGGVRLLARLPAAGRAAASHAAAVPTTRGSRRRRQPREVAL